MQFTISIIAASLLAASSSASPVSIRAQMCSSTPNASGPQTPLSSPTAATADACEKLCEADSSCLSFVFGLPPSSSAPICKLYAVAGSLVPAQDTNLVVFDKACTDIPTTAPTTANPVGIAPSVNTATQQQQQQQKQQKRNVCNAAPTGPATNSPSPLQTQMNINDLAACLALCKSASGCQSVEFGKPSANGQPECLLFQVPAANLPAPTNGQTFVASDIGC